MHPSSGGNCEKVLAWDGCVAGETGRVNLKDISKFDTLNSHDLPFVPGPGRAVGELGRIISKNCSVKRNHFDHIVR